LISRILNHPIFKFGIWWLFWTITGSILIRTLGFGWDVAIIDAAFTQLDWTLAGYAISSMLKYYRPSPKAIINLLFFSLALAALFTFLILPWGLSPLMSALTDAPGFESFLDQSLPVRFVIGWMQLIFITAISWLVSFVQEQQENTRRKADTDKLARDAELTQLRQQLQPHFLFNSLNSINALVGSQPELARKMVQQLSDFLRGVVRKDDRQMVTLEEELQHLGLYLDIEKVRFGYRLNTEISASEESKGRQLPSLLLQPIVENAIKFGLYDTVGTITITLSAQVLANYLVIRVENPFDPATVSKTGTGFGLNSISRRLYLLYSQPGLLETNQNDSIFTTTVKIPQA
jgi:two-component system, LytTR family, sensor kinase